MDDHRGNGKCLEATENSRPHGDRIKDRRGKKDRETENSNNESMGLRDDEMEGHRSISVGIFDRGSANPFIFKIRVGKSQHITPLVDQELNKWESGLCFKVRQCYFHQPSYIAMPPHLVVCLSS
jgi:hypothetical protein